MTLSPLISIFLVVLVDVLGVTMIIPLLPFYAQEFGASPFSVGLLISVFGLGQFFSGPFLGELSDRFGRKPILLLSQLGTFSALLLMASAKTLPVLFLSRALDGITAGNISVAQAYVADVSEPEHRAKSYGLIGIAFGIGFLIGPAISGYLATFGHVVPIYAAAALSATSIVTTLFVLKPVPRGAHRERSFGIDWRGYLACLRTPGVARLLVLFLVFSLSFSLYMSGLALFAERRFTYGGLPFTAREVGYAFSFAGLVGLIAQAGLLGFLVRTIGERVLSAIGFFIMAVGMVALGSVRTLWPVLATVGLISLGSSLLRPSLTSLLSRSVEASRQGVALGLMQSLASFSQVLAPVLSGLLIQRALLVQWAWATALLALVGLRVMRPARSGTSAP
ncbi:MAG: MFS transporter [Oligoflexia bacterium]|nr:MFS transporter [Oligoflexia bacterium]